MFIFHKPNGDPCTIDRDVSVIFDLRMRHEPFRWTDIAIGLGVPFWRIVAAKESREWRDAAIQYLTKNYYDTGMVNLKNLGVRYRDTVNGAK